MDAGMDEPNEQIGVFTSPAAECRIEAVNAIKVATPDRKIAGARAAPLPRSELAHRPERQTRHRSQSVDPAAQALFDPLAGRPRVRPQALAQHRRRQGLREQHTIAGDEPAALRQSAVPCNEIGAHEAIPVEKYAVLAATGQDRAVAYFGCTEPAVHLPDVAERDTDARAPTLYQGGGRRPRAVVGDHRLKLPVGLACQRRQYSPERVGTIVGRHNEGDGTGHVAL